MPCDCDDPEDKPATLQPKLPPSSELATRARASKWHPSTSPPSHSPLFILHALSL